MRNVAEWLQDGGDNVIERLRLIRKERKMTQTELSIATGIHRTLIAKYETGRTNPGAIRLRKLAVALGCTVDELIGNPDDTTVDKIA